MFLGVIKQEGKGNLSKDSSQTIHTILKLTGHVNLRPISLIVRSEIKIDNI